MTACSLIGYGSVKKKKKTKVKKEQKYYIGKLPARDPQSTFTNLLRQKKFTSMCHFFTTGCSI